MFNLKSVKLLIGFNVICTLILSISVLILGSNIIADNYIVLLIKRVNQPLTFSLLILFAIIIEIFVFYKNPKTEKYSTIEIINKKPIEGLCIIIPAYNENKSIANVIQSLKSFTNNILVIDDGSEDNTGLIAEEAGADVLKNVRNRGIGHTIYIGLKHALQIYDSKIFVTIDADGQFNSDEIPKLISPISNSDFSLVLGSRFLSNNNEMNAMKNFGNYLFSKAVSYLIDLELSDTQTGFRALSRQAVQDLHLSKLYTYTQEMIVNVSSNYHQITEVPITVSPRKNGVSKVVKSPLHYGITVSKCMIRIIIDYKSRKIIGNFSFILLIIFLNDVLLQIFMNSILTNMLILNYFFMIILIIFIVFSVYIDRLSLINRFLQTNNFLHK